MADDDQASDVADVIGEDDEGGGGMDMRKIVLFVILPLLILVGVGAGLYFSGALGGTEEEVVEEEKKEEKEPAEEEVVEIPEGEGPAFLALDPLIVNLATSDGNPRFLRLSLQLELASEADKVAIEAVLPRVVDQFQTYLRELRVRDLRGSAGIYRLQKELLSRVNQASAPIEVKDVLFQEILIQ